MPTIELTDGTTTYDLLDAARYSVRVNTFNVGNPSSAQSRSLDYLGDTLRLTDNRFVVRTITMTLDILGNNKTAVVTRIRQLEEVLQQSRDYAIDQTGAKWRLEFDIDGRTIFFNIRDGMLALPPAGMSHLARSGNTTFLAAALSLACDPLGEGAEQSFGPWNRTNAMGSNFVDITPNPPGDYPAKLELRCAENQAHTALWAGARHWPRRTDTPLDLEAEDFSGWDSTPNVTGRSGGEVGRQTFAAAAISTFVDATSGYDGNPGTSETITVPTIAGAAQNRVLLVFSRTNFIQVNSSAAYSPTSGDDVPMRKLNPEASNSVIFAIDNPAPGNQVVITLSASQTRLTWIAALYENVDTNLSARLSALVSDGADYNLASPDDIVVGFVETSTIPVSVTLDNGTIREHLNSARDAAIGEIVAMSGMTEMDWSGNYGAAATTHLVVAAAATEGNEEEATEVVASPKFGQFHALAWVRGESDSAYSLYLSTEYGGVERGPAGSFQHARIEQADAGDWVVRDIGALSVPHGGLPDGANLGPLTLKLNGVATTPGVGADVDLDWDRVLLLPVEGGSAYVEKPSATDHVVLDTLSDAPGAYLWASATVFKGQPKYRGGAIYVHPKGTRIYLASDRSGDARPADGWTVTAKVVPRYLMI